MNIHNGFTALVTESDMALPMNIHNGFTALVTKSDMALPTESAACNISVS